ncbi:MAG: hypothetical protein JSR44_05170 [Spirochaetes bacterium]|nr:hypothetical protein [Spirochaetota bacterium]
MFRRIVIAIFLFSPLFAETPADLTNTYNAMVAATQKLDFEAIIDATYPKLLELAGREALVAEMKKAFFDPTVNVSFVKHDAKPEFGAIRQLKSRRFCVVTRETILRLAFKEPMSIDQAETIRDSIARLSPARKVRFDAKAQAFYSTGPDITLAIADTLTDGKWRFLTHDAALKTHYETWFGKDGLAAIEALLKK